MPFFSPSPLREALQRLHGQTLMPTSAGTYGLDQLPAEIRERAFFSARVTNADTLQRAYDLISRGVGSGAHDEAGNYVPGSYMDLPTFRAEMKDYLASIDYQPQEGQEGSLKDLSSDARLQVIYDTNVQMAQGYGAHLQSQAPAALDAWPAQELYRLEDRRERRAWGQRWNEAAQALGLDATSAIPVEEMYADSGMFALVNDPIWTMISRFGLPYPPFDFNSGMWVRPVSRSQAEELGLLAPGEAAPEPDDRGFNDGMEAAVNDLAPALQEVLSGFGKVIDGIFHISNRWVTIDGNHVLVGEDQDAENPASSSTQAAEIGKGKSAMLRVLDEKGDAMDAISRGDTGPIHFYWGNPGDPANDYKKGYGISKIVAKHGLSVAEEVPEIIVRGRIGGPYHSGQKRNIVHGPYTATISLIKDGRNEHWVLTAFEKRGER